jgi:hypothetical protein
MRRAWVFAALLLASAGAAATLESHAVGQDVITRPRAPAQARTLVKYIVSGSIEIPAAAGTGYFDRGLAVDSAGNIYVGHNNLSTSGPDIAVLDPSGRLLRQWSAAPFGDGPLIAIGPDGLVYVQNRAESFVRVFTPDGVELIARRIEHGGVNTKDIEVDAAGNVYVVARGRGDGGPYSDDGVFRFSSAGQLTGYLVPRPGTRGDDVIGALAVAPDGSVYITAFGGQGAVVLFHLDASGKKLPVFDPRFFLPGNYYDVEFANGRLYFSGPLRGPAATDHTRVAAAVFSPQGELIDFTVGTLADPNRLQQLAVHGENVYFRGLPGTGRAVAQSNVSIIGHLEGVPVFPPGVGGDLYGCDARGNTIARQGEPSGAIPDIALQRPSGCSVTAANIGSPCPKTSIGTPTEVHLGGQEITGATDLHYDARDDITSFRIPANALSSGYLLVKWNCVDRSTNRIEERYEWKGRIDIIDPSGNVFDARTNRPVAGAVVRLQFSLKREGPFGTPDISGFVPQVNPQTSGSDGFFGWDVAEGFWRMQITAFGYKPFTSPVYKIPPEVKGLRLKLRPDPRQQVFVIDPQGGRAGTVRLGAKVKRVRATGLKARVARGRVRSITVRSKRYRTVQGVRLGTPTLELLSVYPPRTRAVSTRLLTARKPVGHRVGKSTFTVRRGSVVGIRLGR